MYNLSLLYDKEEKYKDALQLLNDLLKIDSKFSPAYNARGMILDKQENYHGSYE